MLTGFKDGQDLSILNTIYQGPKKVNDKWDNGSMTIIFKDNETGNKYHEFIPNPDFEFYVYKDGTPNYNMLFAPEAALEKISVPYTKLHYNLAQITNNMAFYKDNLAHNNRYANNRLNTVPKLFGSDEDISDQYRRRFAEHYQNTLGAITKSYLDIEADTINMKGDFPEMGECPINAVTVIFEHLDITATFLLRNPNNPLIEEFEKSVNDDLYAELKAFVQENVGGWKNEIRFGLDKMRYKMFFYDDELQMLQDLFILINRYKPDFVLAWNMAFDIPYIIARLEVLGCDPADIMCHPDFESKVCRYFIDELHRNEYAERGDYATISSYSVYMDQMIQFASRRKGQHAFDSFRLDDIGHLIAKVRKLDYSDITTSIAKLPYLNYKVFVFYNIFDTIVQKCIEKKSMDIDYIYGACLVNNTRYSKGHRQTVYLTNRGNKEFRKDGYVLGNNANKYKPKPEEKYPGAFVADPMKIKDSSKLDLNGTPIPLYYNGDDFDYKALYPSIDREHNLAPNTLIAYIDIPTQVDPNENRYNVDKCNRGGFFVEDYTSASDIEFAHRWFGLGNFETLYNDIVDYYTTKVVPMRAVVDGSIPLITFYDNYDKMKKNLISFDENSYLKPLINFREKRPEINFEEAKL